MHFYPAPFEILEESRKIEQMVKHYNETDSINSPEFKALKRRIDRVNSALKSQMFLKFINTHDSILSPDSSELIEFKDKILSQINESMDVANAFLDKSKK